MELLFHSDQTPILILQNLFEYTYYVDLASRSLVQYNLGGSPISKPQDYDDWLISKANHLLRTNTIRFFSQMELKKLCTYLDTHSEPCIVYAQQKGSDCELQLSITYLDATKKTLIILENKMPSEQPGPLKTMQNLSHCEVRFQLLVQQLLEHFIEVNVQTQECKTFLPGKEKITSHTYSEQLAWWADTLIVPEEKEKYLEEYRLSNLLPKLKNQNGSHTSFYMAHCGDTRRILSISTFLTKEHEISNEEYIFSFAQDVTTLKDQEKKNIQLLEISQQLLNISQTETLTGLYNRAAGEKYIEEHLNTCYRKNESTLLLIDIDNFKSFNDQYGHQTGDFVLKYVSASLRDVFRSDDILSRWGGDEFLVFMRDISDSRNIISRLERLRSKMKLCKKAEKELPVSLSIGAAITSPRCTWKELFAASDKALYQVKRNGRDGYQINKV